MYKVLIVDDEIAVCKGLRILIDWNKYGFEVSCDAYDGLDALEQIKTYHFDVIITDIRIPEVDGIELIRRLKRMNYPARIIILSGYKDFEYAHAAMEFGIKSYIVKPVNEKCLIDALMGIKEELEKESYFSGYRELHESIYKNLIADKYSENSKRNANINIKEVIGYVEKHCLGDITLHGLSEIFFTNPAYLGRIFKRATGLYLNDYVKKLKVEHAARLLKDTNSLVYEISETVGYKDINHFYKVFKELKKVSPSEYRVINQK